MIDVAQAAAPSSDSWTMYLTIVTILFLIIQTVIIAFQTGLFRRQTKILEEQARLSESVELSIKLVHQDPLTSSSNQLRLKVTNEGKGLAMHPVVDCYLVNFKSGTTASGSSKMQSIGSGKQEEVTINLTGGPITPNIPLKCYWAAAGSNGRPYSGVHELSFQ
jgi:hypothetical protein